MATEDLTLKELFARLVVTETKLTAFNNENRKTKRLFHLYVLIMIILFITNIFIHVFAMIG